MNPVFTTSDFRRLWLNAVCNAISVGSDWVLVGWLALEIGGSSAWVGTAFAIYYLPMVLLGVPAGSISDRFERLHLLRIMELVALTLIALFAGLFAAGQSSMALVLWLTAGLGALRAVMNPIRLCFAYDLVGAAKSTQALAGINIGKRIGMFAGALLSGALVQRAGTHYALLIMTLSHLAAFACLSGSFTIAVRNKPDLSPLWQNLKDYVRELRMNRLLLVLTLVTSVVEVFGTSYSTVVPELANSRFGLGAGGLGTMYAAQALGGLLIAILLFLSPQRHSSSTLFAASIVGIGLSIIALGYATNLVAVLFALAGVSGMITAWDIYTQSLMQQCVPDHLRGRAMGAWVFAIGSSPFGHLEIGFLTTLAGVELALYSNGMGVIAVITIAYLSNRSLRRM